MLEIKVNKSEFKYDYVRLYNPSLKYDKEKRIINVVSNNHGLTNTDYIYLKRVIDGIEYSEQYLVNVIDENNFYFRFNPYLTLEVISNYYNENEIVVFFNESHPFIESQSYCLKNKEHKCPDYFTRNIWEDSNYENKIIGGCKVNLINDVVEKNYLTISDKYKSYKDYAFFYVMNCLFLDINDLSDLDEQLYFKENAFIYKKSGIINCNINLTEEFNKNLTLEEDITENYIDKIINRNINDIIDYEKQMFHPIFKEIVSETSGGVVYSIKDLNKIRFNLHFREKNLEDFTTKTDKYWNNYELVCDDIDNCEYILVNKSGYEGNRYGDSLADIGYNPEIDFQGITKRLTKSFIRLSFYDKPDRNTQMLLFYSTLFIDGNKIYSEYNKSKFKDSDIVSDLFCSFDTYDMYNEKNSSEGFYLYFYPNIISGKTETEVYMKVEFNHAKYGKTIPFICPVSKDGQPIEATSLNFPISYVRKDIIVTEEGEKENIYMDMKKLYEDMYIKVLLSFDEKKRRYNWRLPFKVYNAENTQDKENTIEIALYEPRLDVNEFDLKYTKNINVKEFDPDEYYKDYVKLECKYYTSETANVKIISKKNYKSFIRAICKENSIIEPQNGFLRLNRGITSISFYLKPYENGIIIIPNGAFQDLKYLCEIKISNSENNTNILTEISNNAFAGCKNLNKIVFNEGLRKIGERAFQGDTFIPMLTFPSSLEYIGNGAFGRNIRLKNITFNSSVKLESFAFSKCYDLNHVNTLENTFLTLSKSSFAYDTHIINRDNLFKIEDGEVKNVICKNKREEREFIKNGYNYFVFIKKYEKNE